MPDLTPESLSELRRLMDDVTIRLGTPRRAGKAYARETLAAAAVNALPALLNAAERLAEVEEAVRRGARCPMCSGPVRQTVGMVCQLCGANWSFDASSGRALAAESATTAKAVLSEALAVRAERDALRDDLADLREEVAAINQRRDDLDAERNALAAEADKWQLAALTLETERDALAAKVERVRAMHVRHSDHRPAQIINGPWYCCGRAQLGAVAMDNCNVCGEYWPCPTIRALDGTGTDHG